MHSQDTKLANANAPPSWKPALLALLGGLVIIQVSALVGVQGTRLFDVVSGASEAGAHAPGDLEAMSAARLGAYFAAFQITAVVLTILGARILARHVAQVLPLGRPRGGIAAIAVSIVALLVVALGTGALVYVFDKTSFMADMQVFSSMARSRLWWLLLLAAGLGAPLAEELLFRGLMFSGLRASPLGFAGAAVISAAMWTSLHASYSVYGLALLMVIGLYFAWLREKTGSLLPAIAGHAVYNSLVVLALSFAPEHALA